ncbi:GlxA family transcriptional regulator [Pseudomonas sp. HR96]|uniref:GlxA family transcriptional regulator n=1 Tax=Pseudomonas sp. HR96 TaxID=1027966 RepID=UPI002A765281|nr:GlxA family transcriptional regulator [Pseudomonas sp. HR96]WPP01584.1 GlxA family transcriptional regulator [Pseudomonas sp. HR96]
MNTVALVLYPDFLLLDMAGPVEVFSIANRYLPAERHYRILTLSARERRIRASNGIILCTDHLLEDAPMAHHLLLVPGGPGAYGANHAELLPWLRDAAGQSRRYGAVCTGAFILGHAGLLDGHRVTTHWHYTERLLKAFPLAQVGSDQIYVHDRKLITSGGVTAGIDMALSIVAEDHGRAVALDVAKVLLVLMTRQGGQAQFSPLVAAMAGQDSPVARAQAHMLEHLHEALTVQHLAQLAAMSTRHFSRVFLRETGLTPMEFLQNARIDHARQLLESSELPLKTVAWRSGFGSVRHMRFLFGERLGLSPSQYRQQFA